MIRARRFRHSGGGADRGHGGVPSRGVTTLTAGMRLTSPSMEPTLLSDPCCAYMATHPRGEILNADG
jgi:hypothetical protein